jgi:sulfite exporter TauE/SafE
MPTDSLFGIEGLGIIIALFLTGLAGSFTHCIGMCGPFAVAQTSMRLMNIPNKNLKQKERLKASLLIPYYFGKALTYCALLSVVFFISENFKNTVFYKYLALFFLGLAALIFLRIAINKNFNFIKIPILQKFVTNQVDMKNTMGLRGVIAGMILGLIPCGLVYAAIVAALSATDNVFIALAAMFAFAMATVPGLFVISYLGQYVLKKYAKIFNISFSIIMIMNAILIVRYALKLL